MITSKLSLVQHFFPQGPLVAWNIHQSPRTDRNPCCKVAELLQDSCPASRSHSLSEPLMFSSRCCEVFFVNGISSSEKNLHVTYKYKYTYISSYIHTTYAYCISGTNMNVINMYRTVSEKSKRTGRNKIHGSWGKKTYVLHTDENRPSPET